MTVQDYFDEKPPSCDYILPDFPVGSVGMLTGPARSGKTLFALELCCAVACSLGEEANLLDLPVHSHGPVFYLNGEDSEGDLHRLIHAIGSHLSPEARRSIAKNLYVDVGIGLLQDITDEECRTVIVDLCRDSRLIVIDTFSRFHGLDESNRNHAAQLIGALDNVARETGAALLCLDLPNPVSTFSERVQWRAKLRTMEEGEARGVSENSVGSPSINKSRDKIEAHRYFREFWVTDSFYGNLGTLSWFKLTDKGVLVPARLFAAEDE